MAVSERMGLPQGEEMSKIPQGEWNAIAARHAQGESLSAIARSYGCTPPAIHYVLKRNGRQPAEKVEQPAEAAATRPNEPDREAPPQTLRSNGEIKLSLNRANEPAGGGSREPATPPMGPTRSEQRPAPTEHRLAPIEQRPASIEQPRVTELQQHRAPSPTAGRALASTDGLDSELHERAEAAIETFRACFDAALAEGSPHERARLRQAASDLMRVAARTTIVLDRLNALSERAAVWSDPRSIGNRRA
jgi:transposase-like protein